MAVAPVWRYKENEIRGNIIAYAGVGLGGFIGRAPEHRAGEPGLNPGPARSFSF